jgi:uncharacterized membrane protein YvbJ
MTENKMKPCRACGKDTEVGKACDTCGWDEEKEQVHAKRRRLEKEVDEEISKEEEKKKAPGKRRLSLPFSRD